MTPDAVQRTAPPELPAAPVPLPPLPLPRRAPPLWREVADGSAGAGVRAVVSVALAPLLAGVACFASFVLAGVAPSGSSRGRSNVSPSDELVGCMLGLAAAAYLAALAWIWTRGRLRALALWRAGVLTLAGIALAIVLCVAIDDSQQLRGSQEVLIGAVVCLFGGALILLWLQSVRAFLRGKPTHDPADGALDVRCPSCGYRMVGLRETRCPECGTAYTIDELLGQQEFLVRARLAQSAPPPASPARDGVADESGVVGRA